MTGPLALVADPNNIPCDIFFDFLLKNVLIVQGEIPLSVHAGVQSYWLLIDNRKKVSIQLSMLHNEFSHPDESFDFELQEKHLYIFNCTAVALAARCNHENIICCAKWSKLQ